MDWILCIFIQIHTTISLGQNFVSHRSVPQDLDLLRLEFRLYLLLLLPFSFLLFLEITTTHPNRLNFECEFLDYLTSLSQESAGLGLFERLRWFQY